MQRSLAIRVMVTPSDWLPPSTAEQARIVQLLVDRIIVGTAGLDVRLRVDGLGVLVRELQAPELEAAA